jgi:hypothetical protein
LRVPLRNLIFTRSPVKAAGGMGAGGGAAGREFDPD